MKRDVPVKSLKKALDILTTLLFDDPEENGFALHTLAELHGMPRNSVHNLLKTMTACGYVEKNLHARYTYGPVCRKMIYHNYRRDADFREKLIGIMRETDAQLGVVTVYAVLQDYHWLPMMRISPRKIYPIDSEVLGPARLYETATGRVLYSCSTPTERSRILERNGHPEGIWADHEAEMQKVRRRKFVFVHRFKDGVDTGRETFAVPVFRGDGKLEAALGCYYPGRSPAVTPALEAEVRRVLLNAAARITELWENPPEQNSIRR